MTLAGSFSFPLGGGSLLVLGYDHNGLYGYAQPGGLCPLRDSEGNQTLLPLVHTGKAEGLDDCAVNLRLSLNGRDNTLVALVMMLTFLVAICTTLLFGQLTET